MNIWWSRLVISDYFAAVASMMLQTRTTLKTHLATKPYKVGYISLSLVWALFWQI
jgi:hypothetical protein